MAAAATAAHNEFGAGFFIVGDAAIFFGGGFGCGFRLRFGLGLGLGLGAHFFRLGFGYRFFCGFGWDGGAIADTFAAGMAGSALDAAAGVIEAGAVFAEPSELTERGIGSEAGVFNAVAFVATFPFGALFALAGVGFALSVDTTFASGAGSADRSTGAIRGATILIGFALFAGAGIVLAFSFDAVFSGGAGDFVTARILAFAIDTDRLTGTIDVVFTGQDPGTLSLLALLLAGALYTVTGVVFTLAVDTDATGFAGIFFAGILGAFSVDADLSAGAGHAGAGIGDAFSIDTDRALFAEDTGAGVDALASAAELSLGAGDASTGVFLAGATDTEFALGTIGVFGAGGDFALSVDTELIAGTIFIDLTRGRRGALT